MPPLPSRLESTMHQTALATDFARLPPDVQKSHLEILRLLERRRMSCRCEQNGRDFTIVIGRGLSSAKYWIDMYEPHAASSTT